jgi:hypothetical protein
MAFFTNYSASDIPGMKKEMRAFLSSTSGAAPPVYHSTLDYLSSNQDPDSPQNRKVGLFLFQIPISVVLTSRSVEERTSVCCFVHISLLFLSPPIA